VGVCVAVASGGVAVGVGDGVAVGVEEMSVSTEIS
jgi:hypothetical protein